MANEIDPQIERVWDKLTALTEAHKELKDRVKALEEHEKAQDLKIQKLEDQLKCANEEIAETQAEVAALSAKLCDTNIADLKAQVAGLQNQMCSIAGTFTSVCKSGEAFSLKPLTQLMAQVEAAAASAVVSNGQTITSVNVVPMAGFLNATIDALSQLTGTTFSAFNALAGAARGCGCR